MTIKVVVKIELSDEGIKSHIVTTGQKTSDGVEQFIAEKVSKSILSTVKLLSQVIAEGEDGLEGLAMLAIDAYCTLGAADGDTEVTRHHNCKECDVPDCNLRTTPYMGDDGEDDDGEEIELPPGMEDQLRGLFSDKPDDKLH